MTLPEEHRDRAAQLHSALQASDEFASDVFYFDRYPGWYGEMLTEVLLLTLGQDVVYATGKADGDAKTAEILAITDRLMIRVAVTERDGDRAIVRTTATPLSAIRSVTVGARASVFDQDLYSRWPGRLRIEATFDGGDPISVPFERLANPSEDLSAVLAVLRGALTSQ